MSPAADTAPPDDLLRRIRRLEDRAEIGELVAAVAKKEPAVVVVPSLPPAGLAPARHLCKRLQARVGSAKLIAARLGDPEEERERRAAQLESAGCHEVATSLADLASSLRLLVRAKARHATNGVNGNGSSPANGTTLAQVAHGG